MKAVLFDLDGTLHDRNATIRQWIDEHVRKFDLPDGYAARFLKLDDFGYRSKTDVIPQLIKEFSLPHDAQTLYGDFSNHFFSHPILMPYAHEVLSQLRRQGIKTGLVTNGWVEKQTQTVTGLALAPLLDDIVISKAVGVGKPNPRIYQLALERLGVAPSETWFVGDSPRNDVWGPQQIGLRTAFLYTGHALGMVKPDVVLEDLRDVLLLK